VKLASLKRSIRYNLILQVELEQANRDNNVESCGGIRTKKAETKKKALNEVEVVRKKDEWNNCSFSAGKGYR
jgi:hypothetical protein